MAFGNIRFLVLWLTRDCNLRCRYCYADAGKHKEYMNFEVAKRAIDLCGENCIKLQFAGGEPILNFKLVERLYDYIKSNNISAILQMQANGTLIDYEIARHIKKMNIAMGVSFDGPIEINEYLRGNSKDVLRGMSILREEGIMANINCVVTDRNIEYLDKLVDIAYYLGNVGGIGLDLLRLTGRAIDTKSEVMEASPLDIKSSLEKAYLRTKEIESISGKKVIIREIEEARKRLYNPPKCGVYCHASYGGSAVVLPNGDIYPCGSLVGLEEYYMGNVLDEKTIKNIKVEIIPSARCQNCKYKSFCQGACPARGIINKNGVITEQDCTLRKTSFEIVEKET